MIQHLPMEARPCRSSSRGPRDPPHRLGKCRREDSPSPRLNLFQRPRIRDLSNRLRQF